VELVLLTILALVTLVKTEDTYLITVVLNYHVHPVLIQMMMKMPVKHVTPTVVNALVLVIMNVLPVVETLIYITVNVLHHVQMDSMVMPTLVKHVTLLVVLVLLLELITVPLVVMIPI
jgi:hypothetical protein